MELRKICCVGDKSVASTFHVFSTSRATSSTSRQMTTVFSTPPWLFLLIGLLDRFSSYYFHFFFLLFDCFLFAGRVDSPEDKRWLFDFFRRIFGLYSYTNILLLYSNGICVICVTIGLRSPIPLHGLKFIKEGK